MRRPFGGVPGSPQSTEISLSEIVQAEQAGLEAGSSFHIFRYHLSISIVYLASITASCTGLPALMPSKFVPTIHGHGSAICTFGTR